MPAGPYSFQLIDPPFDTHLSFRSVSVSDINDAGQVLGRLANSTGGQPFLYQDGNYTLLSVPDASKTIATQLNEAGEVIGRYTDGAGGAHAFVYADSTYSEVAVPGAASTIALQISDGGQILVQYADDTGRHWAVDDNGTFTPIAVPDAEDTDRPLFLYPLTGGKPAINSAGEVVGSYNDDTDGHAFLYDGHGGYTTLAVPGAAFTTATEINNAGQVLGYYGLAPSDPATAYVYSDGAYTTIAVPGASRTDALQINDAGQVAGTYVDGTGTHVFLETDGNYVTVPSPFDSVPPGSIPLPGGLPPILSGNATDGADIPLTTSSIVILPELTFLQLSNAGDVLARDNGIGGGTFVFSGGASAPAGVPDALGASALRINDAGQVIGTFFDGGIQAFLATPLGSDGGAPAANGSASSDLGSAAAAGLLAPTDGGAGAMLGVPDPGVLRA